MGVRTVGGPTASGIYGDGCRPFAGQVMALPYALVRYALVAAHPRVQDGGA